MTTIKNTPKFGPCYCCGIVQICLISAGPSDILICEPCIRKTEEEAQ